LPLALGIIQHSLVATKLMSEPDLHTPASSVDMCLREKINIEKALQATDWKIYGPGGAAELLGIKPTTLLSRIKKMGISKKAIPS
jgi:transcriptional regulator with GAF, ATPase, and Fis domain